MPVQTPSPRPASGSARIAAALLSALLVAAPGAAAAARGAQANPQAAAASDAIHRLIADEIGGQRRIEVRVGQLDPRLRLAACARAEPFVPHGARLWGRSSIGVRCVDGASWTVMLPVTISVFDEVLVANATMAAGSVPTPADFRLQEVDLTRQHGALVTDPAQLDGRVLARALAAGQPLREDAMKLPPVFSSGDPVPLLVAGQGFTITSDGIAMGSAGEGQRLRVRTNNGRIVVGQVRDRVVHLAN